MYIKALIILATLLFMSGCGESPTVDTSKDWMQNPPADNSKYFYAIGYGETQKDAKSDALATISAKISVEVASKFSSSLTATRLGGDEDVLATTKSEVVSKSKNIEYTDVKVQQSHNNGYQWAVLVAVDRDILTQMYERKLEAVDEKLKMQWRSFQNASVFEKLKLSVTMERNLKEADSFFPLLHALNTYYDERKYTKQYLDYTSAIKEAKKQVVYKILSDKNSQPLASLIRSELSAHNATFSNENYNVLLNITTEAKMRKYPSADEKFANLTFALRDTVIKVTDKNGNIISNAIYKTKSGSSEGFEDAIARTAKYEEQIKEIGITAFITGN